MAIFTYPKQSESGKKTHSPSSFISELLYGGDVSNKRRRESAGSPNFIEAQNSVILPKPLNSGALFHPKAGTLRLSKVPSQLLF